MKVIPLPIIKKKAGGLDSWESWPVLFLMKNTGYNLCLNWLENPPVAVSWDP